VKDLKWRNIIEGKLRLILDNGVRPLFLEQQGIIKNFVMNGKCTTSYIRCWGGASPSSGFGSDISMAYKSF
jgi:hypothetical protein